MKELLSSENSDLQPLVSPWISGFVVAFFVWIEASVFGNGISESSMTEFGQEALLLTSGILTGFVAWRYPAIRSVMVLFTGLFGCMLIRELDALFDKVFHGFWLYPALTVAVGAILYAMRCPKIGFRQALDIVKSPSFRLLNFGLLTVLVISRIVGSGRLWYLFMDEKSLGHFFKNVIQEGLELWGYALIATGVWCVLSRLRSSKVSSRQRHAMPKLQSSHGYGHMAQ